MCVVINCHRFAVDFFPIMLYFVVLLCFSFFFLSYYFVFSVHFHHVHSSPSSLALRLMYKCIITSGGTRLASFVARRQTKTRCVCSFFSLIFFVEVFIRIFSQRLLSVMEKHGLNRITALPLPVFLSSVHNSIYKFIILNRSAFDATTACQRRS